MKRVQIKRSNGVSTSFFFALFLTSFLLSPISNTAAYTNSGTIASDETWSGQIDLAGDVTVTTGVTLTIQPGTVIRFADGAGLVIYGKLEALGTVASPITFTSASATPTKGIWRGIYFYDTSIDASTLDHAVIQYADRGVSCDHASPTVSNSTLSDNLTAIFLNYSNALIKGCPKKGLRKASGG